MQKEITKRYSIDAVEKDDHVDVLFQRFDKRTVETAEGKPVIEYYNKVPIWKITVERRPDASQGEYNVEALRRAIELICKKGGTKALQYTLMTIGSSSAVFKPTFVHGSTNVRVKYRFSPAPAVRPEIPMLAAGVEDALLGLKRRVSLKRSSCCGELKVVLEHECGYRICAHHYSQDLNFGSHFEAPICPQCEHPIYVTRPTGPFGFHSAYASGHYSDSLIPLVKHLDQPTVATVFSEQDCRLLSDCIDKATKLILPTIPDSSVPIWDLADPTYITQEFPESGVGLFANATHGTKKCDLVDQIRSKILEEFNVTKTIKGIPNKVMYLRKALSNIMQTSIKLEVRAGTKDENGDWIQDGGERIFYIENAIVFAVMKSVFGPFANCGGLSDEVPKPNAIGMTFSANSSWQYVKEMFSLGSTTPNFKSTTKFEDVAEFEKNLMKDWLIVEADISKYDMHVKPYLVQLIMKSIFKKFNFESVDEPESELFKAVLCRILECSAVKISSSPCGDGFYVMLSGLCSGSYITSFINTYYNLTMHLFVLSKMFGQKVVFNAWNSGPGNKINAKFFGDDVILTLHKSKFPKFDGEAYRNLIKQYFNMTIKPCNFKLCTHLTVNNMGDQDDRPDENAPSFLKFQLCWVQCPECSKYHTCFFRHHTLILPKIFHNSVKTLNLQELKARSIGYAWICGVNPIVWKACKLINDSIPDDLGRGMGWMNIDPEIKRKLEVHNIEVFDESFPAYDEVVYRNSCPKYTHKIRHRVRDFIPWQDMVRALHEKKFYNL